jgi:two-component system chemotaxis sensor kinase CheA
MPESNNAAETFRHEAEDLLGQIEEIALQIEPGRDATEEVNRLFRAFHTIKGSGAMFGFSAVADFTHHVETMLDGAREGTVPLSPEMIAQILAARDHIAVLLAADLGGSAPPSGDAIVAACRALTASNAAAPAPVAPPPSVPPETAGAAKSYHVRFRPNLNLLAAGTDPRLLLDELRALGDCTVRADVSALPTLEQIQPDSCYLRWDIALTTDKSPAAIRDIFMFVEEGAELCIEENAPTTPAVPQMLPSALHESSTPASLPPRAAERCATGNEVTHAARASAPVRVASERLDLLVNLVGELVMTHSRIAQVAAKADLDALVTPVEDLERIVDAIRDAVLGIRMTPIGATFNRFKRLVHDLSAELGKEIDLHILGEDTELDKTVLDQLGDPLVHLVRNCIDHGVEPPQERVRLGKPPHAAITLSAVHTGAQVVVSIADDGRGLDLAAIRAKAVERKLISAEAQLSEKEIVDLIFLPGFSTAKQLTSVSGRGVGMDVVRRQVDALRGKIQVKTVPGRGTTISLSLPLTLAIIEGQLVEIGHDQFIVPMASVAENVELESFQRLGNNGRNVIPVRGELVSYIRLRDLFEIRTPPPEIEKVVIVHHDGGRFGLVVDRVLGSHQTVIQSLGRFYRNIEVASGATIMGDGRVALILDLGGLVRTTARTGAAIESNTLGS